MAAPSLRDRQAREYVLTDMKAKITRLIIIVLSSISPVCAQEAGRHNISLGVGFPNLLSSFLNIYGSEKDYTHRGTGPFHVKYEYRIWNRLGLGVNVNYVSTKISYTKDFVDDNGTMIHNHIIIKTPSAAINFRTNLHFLNVENHPRTDFYFGLGIGYKLGGVKITADYAEGAPSLQLPALWHLGFEATLGYRHFFTDNIGLYGELGIAKSIIQGGIVGRF